MPEIAFLIPAVIAVAVLMIVVFCFTWLITHSLVIIAVVGIAVWFGVYSRRRSRV